MFCAGQSNFTSLNKQHLESLVKEKVDSLRLSKGLNPLANDSILYLAANFHADYMVKKGILSHNQTGKDAIKTPQERAEHFKAINYLVGENIMNSPVNTTVKDKKGKLYNTNDINQLAHSIYKAWEYSPGHYKNMIEPNYEITGLAIQYDPEKEKIYACQKFAQVQFKHHFEENNAMFPYSNYQSPPLITSFNGIENQLTKHDHPWGLKHDNEGKCAVCFTNNTPFFSLELEDNKFKLKIENSEYVKQLIHDKYDGFAVELVFLEDYMCDNSEYYTKPSRRNGQCKVNGQILQPVYKKDLFKGYKKRKAIKDVKFVSYVTGADSVKFIDRFKNFKTARFTSEYFETTIARLPKDVQGYFGYNLIYIQNKQICKTAYFHNYCGNVLFDEYQLDTIIPQYDWNYLFPPIADEIKFIVPFEKNQSEFDKEDVQPLLQSLNNLTYIVDSIHIKAYSSVEGDSITNQQLQIERAKNLAEILKTDGYQNIPVNIETQADWAHFRRSARQIPALNQYARISQDSLESLMQHISINDTLENILKKERRGEVELNYHLPFNRENLVHYMVNHLEYLTDSLEKVIHRPDSIHPLVYQLDSLYAYIYMNTFNRFISDTTLAQLEIPRNALEYAPLKEKYVLFGYLNRDEFVKNTQWKNKVENYEYQLTMENVALRSPEFLQMFCTTKALEYKDNPNITKEDIQFIFNTLELLEKQYNGSKAYKQSIDKIILTLNYRLMDIFKMDPKAHADDAIELLYQLYQFYEANDLLTPNRKLELASAHVYFFNIHYAAEILKSMEGNPQALAYLLVLYYSHPTQLSDPSYYNALVESVNQLDPEIWCNLFLNECKIPFQAFDHEELRNLFCEKCLQQNDFFNSKINGKK